MALACLGLTAVATAQNSDGNTVGNTVPRYQHNGWFNHIDVAFTAGTSGLGFDLATPMSGWARLRMGGTFRPQSHYSANIEAEIAEGLPQEVQEQRFDKLSGLMKAFMNVAPERNIEMEGTMKMNNFKMLVDIFPIKRHRNFRVTAGFYYGNGTLIAGRNTDLDVNTLSAISTYNMMYTKALDGEFLDMSELGIHIDGEIKQAVIDKLKGWGEIPAQNGVTAYAEHGISLPMGTYAHDIIAQQDIYDRKGNLMHKKGEVVRQANETVRLTPDNMDMINMDVRVNKFKPYIGMGYECAITKDKRTKVALDAGIIFWGGKPSATVNVPIGMDSEGNSISQTIDLVQDVNGIPGDMGDHIGTLKDYSVFPEISLRLSQRIW